jgi:hypothetical protein
MRCFLTVGGMALAVGFLGAQERIPPETAQKYARHMVEHAAKQQNLQLKVDADPERPFGLKHEEVGAMVIPDKKLSEDALKNAGRDTLPVAQLWVRKLTLVVKDQPLPNDRLRIVTVTAEGEDHPLPLFLLGVRKKAGNDLELVVYGPEKEPLLSLPLQKVDIRQELPFELEGKRGDNDRGVLTLNILGKYQARLDMAKQE